MPTYEYACTPCGQHLEVVQSFSRRPLTTCPVCGGPMRKVFGTIGIVLKGSGFYKTDSRSSSSKSGGEAGGAKKAADGERIPVDAGQGVERVDGQLVGRQLVEASARRVGSSAVGAGAEARVGCGQGLHHLTPRSARR